MGGGCSGTMRGNIVERFFHRDYGEQGDDCMLTRHTVWTPALTGGSDGRLVEDAGRAGEDFHQEVKVGDAPLDEGHPGVVEEVLDVFPPAGGEVVDDDDVVVLS
jgi:hypothetical protein